MWIVVPESSAEETILSPLCGFHNLEHSVLIISYCIYYYSCLSLHQCHTVFITIVLSWLEMFPNLLFKKDCLGCSWIPCNSIGSQKRDHWDFGKDLQRLSGQIWVSSKYYLLFQLWTWGIFYLFRSPLSSLAKFC